MDRLKHLQSHLLKASDQLALKNQSKADMNVLSSRLMPSLSEIQENVKACIDLLSNSGSNKDEIIKSRERLALQCDKSLEQIKNIGLPVIKPRWTVLTDAGPGVSVTKFEVQIKSMEICRLWNLDYCIRLHRSRGDS